MTPLVFIPGMMCDARLWASQMEVLGRRTIMHAPCSEHDSMQALAASILAEAPPRFALAGLSMGGIVAMEVFRQAPERVEGLALLDTNPLAETARVAERRGPQIERVRSGRLAEVMRDEMKPLYVADGPNKNAILDLCMAMALDLGPDVFERQSVALRERPDQTETLRQVTVPALVLCGAEDRLCPVSRHVLMHELIDESEFVIIEKTGHLPTLEAPERVNAALTAWLDLVR